MSLLSCEDLSAIAQLLDTKLCNLCTTTLDQHFQRVNDGIRAINARIGNIEVAIENIDNQIQTSLDTLDRLQINVDRLTQTTSMAGFIMMISFHPAATGSSKPLNGDPAIQLNITQRQTITILHR
jgi:hypothetical protein